jgi:hypothetical protein
VYFPFGLSVGQAQPVIFFRELLENILIAKELKKKLK